MKLDADGVRRARALLFVPASRPDRFDKALAAGAHGVIVDLEDAVAPPDKDSARRAVADWLAAGGDAIIRVNAADTRWHDADVALAVDFGCPVMVPKAEDPAVAAAITDRGAGCPVVLLVETPVGVERARELSAAGGVVRLAFGNADLAAELGVAHDDHLALQYARSRLVLASAAAGIAAPLDGVTTSLRDAELVARDARHARRLGFGGKLCVHPSQVPAVVTGFAPTEEELRWAREVVRASAGVSAVDGSMVDRPLVARAQRLLDSPP